MAKVIHGGASNEQLIVTTDKTQAYGLSGDDTIISGGNSNILLIGGSGNDSLVMMGGIGTLNGGKGSDTFELNYSAVNGLSAVIEDYEQGDKILVNFDGASAPQLTSVKSGNDVIWTDGSNFNLTLKSERENDYFDGDADPEVWEVLERTNNERENPTTVAGHESIMPERNLPWLTLSEGLMIGAESRASEIKGLDEMGALSNHKRPDGSDYFTVKVGENLSLSAKYKTYGENLEAGAVSSASAMSAWIGSLSHHKNILDADNKGFSKLGVSYLYDDSSEHEHYWTQLFAGSLSSPSSISLDGLSISQVHTVSTAVTLTNDDNDYSNTLNGATISGTSSANSITNTGVFVSIAGGDGADTIDNSGANVTINGGAGDDSIQLGSDNLIEYRAGDGNDTVSGFNETDTLRIIGDAEFMPVTVDNDVIVSIGEDSITLKDAANINVKIDGTRSSLYIYTDDDDTIDNAIDGATIQALGGNDKITNSGSNVSIDAGDGNDTVDNSGDFATICAGSGNDSIINSGGASVLFIYDSGDDTISGFRADSTLRVSDEKYYSVASGNNLTLMSSLGSIKLLNVASLSNIVDANGEPVTVGDAKNRDYTEGADTINNSLAGATINALGGNDSIVNSGAQVTIYGGEGNDSINNEGSRVTINSGAGDDSISNSKASVTIDSGNGDDFIDNSDNRVSIDAGIGNDFIDSSGDSVTIDSGSGDDTIHNTGNRVSIDSGEGNDSVNNEGSRVTIRTGAGNDTITNSGNTVAIHYGGGNDIIEGFNETSTLNLGNYAWQTVKSDAGVLVYVTSNDETIGKIMIKDYVGDPQDNIKSTWKPSSAEGTVIANYTSDTMLTGGDGDDEIYNDSLGSNVTINGGAGNDAIINSGDSVTIDGRTGNDFIENYGINVSINGATGSDEIHNWSNTVTMSGGTGDDLIDNDGDSVTIDGGAGDDDIYNFGSNVTISGGADDDTVINSNSGSQSGSQVIIDAGDGVDSVWNDGSSVTIDTGDGDDTVVNYGYRVTINTGDGNDDVYNYDGSSVTIDTGDGEDFVYNYYGSSVTIDTGEGNDEVDNYVSSVTINTGAGNDSVGNSGDSVTIDTGDGNDTVYNYVSSVTINTGAGNDSVGNSGDSVTIDTGDGDDTVSNGYYEDGIYQGGGSYVSISAGAGNDSITNSGSNVSILGGAGDDTIQNDGGSNVTILGGTGNDQISLSSDSKNHLVQYTPGDGDDTIWGLKDTGKQLKVGTDDWSTEKRGSDVIVKVGNGSITLKNFKGKVDDIIIGESGTSGGGSGDGNGGNSSGGNDNGGNGGNGNGSGNNGGNGNSGSGGKDNSSGGTSQNEGRGSSATSGKSASGSSGRGTSTGLSNGGSRGGSNSGGNDIGNANSYNYYYNNELSVTPFSSPFDALRTPNANQYVYTGANMVIDTYQAGEKIFFLTDYTGATFDGLGNLIVGSSTGALVVQNAMDKFIDHYDAAGNPLLKAYAATTAGVIDGRWQAGFEVLNGSAGSDLIFAGDGGSQLLGGMDVVSDTLVGGNGTDTFVIGKTQGADIVLNASSADVVHLNDATLSDVFATAENDGAITVAFNTGNAIAVQSSEALSATFMLADGSAYRYNHAAKTWQSVNQNIYAGGNQIITDYQAGEKILFNATYTGATFDNAGNLIVGSSTGALAVTNATDKVINLSDATGNDFIKAYAATTAGVIDGRGLAGFEVINGSAGSDAVFAGNGGSQLWGGADNAADTLVGGNGSDIFIGGKAQGSDVILNASSADVVHLNDATLSDIIGTAENNGAITLAFNTGNVIAVQSSEAQSAAFQLADGSAYRYNHASKSWQSA